MGQKYRNGFALPTILISSIVMLTVLLVSVSSATAVRVAIQNQYYSQLAQAAGDAGVAYAKACLSANHNVPQWSNSNPLTPSTDCTGTVQSGYPTSVVTNGNIVSSYSIGLPTSDSNGRALIIPNNGFVNILRTSTGVVWRTYQQPSAQPAEVPDLCSGAAASTYGWSNAIATTISPAIADSSALPITIATGNVNPGPIYLRKDFTITKAGTYDLALSVDDQAYVYIDGTLVTTVTSGLGSGTINLQPGCHTIVVKVNNYGVYANPAGLSLSLKLAGTSIPVLVTDTSWRVEAGSAVSYSTPNYYASSAWSNVIDIRTSPSSDGNWTATSGDPNAYFVSNTSGNAPPSEWTNYRDGKDVLVTSNTQVHVTVQCDDSCILFMDGNPIINGAAWSADYSATITMAAGIHHFGIASYNAGTTANPSGFSFAAVRTSDGAVLSQSDTSWLSTGIWNAVDPNPYSYDDNFSPNPGVLSRG